MKHKIKKSNSFLTRQTEACKILQLKNAKNIILRLDDNSSVSNMVNTYSVKKKPSKL